MVCCPLILFSYLPAADLIDQGFIESLAEVAKSLWHETLPSKMVKIAIIDDGVDVSQLDTTKIVAGMSFAYGSLDRFQPYYFSSAGFGTRMVQLISAACPALEFYIARLDPKRWSAKSINEVRS